jgi:hypothetical protein
MLDEAVSRLGSKSSGIVADVSMRIPLHPIRLSGGIRSLIPKDPIRESERSDERDDDQAAGWGSGWGLRPFWRRREEPRSGRM